MPQAFFRVYEELNDYLPENIQKKQFVSSFDSRKSIKELIESLGIPCEEVDLILANGISVDFSYTVKDQDKMSVYPIFETFDITGVTKVRDMPLSKKKKGSP